MTTYNSFWEAAPFVGGGAFILGGGARVAKGLLDLIRREDPESSPENIKETEPPVTTMPVAVTPEEAAYLRSEGVPVPRRKQKVAALSDFDVGPAAAFGLGALGTGALMAGWKATDAIVDAYRKNRAIEKREKLRRRIEGLFSDTPDPVDAKLYASMKAAESVHFDKTASFSIRHHVVNPFAALLGGTALLALIREYNKAVVGGEQASKIKALKSYLKKQKTVPPVVSATPVELIPESTPSAGSPAQQAAANAQLAVPTV